MAQQAAEQETGRVVSVIGPVVDMEALRAAMDRCLRPRGAEDSEQMKDAVVSAFGAYGEPELAEQFIADREGFLLRRHVTELQGLVYPSPSQRWTRRRAN